MEETDFHFRSARALWKEEIMQLKSAASLMVSISQGSTLQYPNDQSTFDKFWENLLLKQQSGSNAILALHSNFGIR